jgi:ABC-type phosphate/phosphonate transport system substrate-binding protein
VLLHVLLVSACTGFAASPDDREPTKLIMGMSARMLPDVDLRDAQASMRMWVEASNQTDNRFLVLDVRILADEAEMCKAVEKKEINYVIALAVEYIRLRDLGLVGKDNAAGVGGDVTDEYVVLVNREGDIKNIEGLRQKKVIVQAGGLGGVPTIWLDTVLMKQGLPASRQFCREVKLVPKASGAMLPVFFGQADACVVVKKAFMTMAELNPQIGKRLSVLVKSPGFPRAVSWFGKDWNKETLEECRNGMLVSSDTPAGQQFLTLLGYKRVTIWDPISLGPLEALLKEYEELCRKAGQKPAQADGVRPESAAAPQPPGKVPETITRTDPQSSKGK